MQNIQSIDYTITYRQVCPNKSSPCKRPAFKSEDDRIEIKQTDTQRENKSSTGVIVGALIAVAAVIAGIYAIKKGGTPTGNNAGSTDVAKKLTTSNQLEEIKKNMNLLKEMVKTHKPASQNIKSSKDTGIMPNVQRFINDLKVGTNETWKTFSKTNSQIIKSIKRLPIAERQEAYHSYYKQLLGQNVVILDRVLLSRRNRGFEMAELNAIEKL